MSGNGSKIGHIHRYNGKFNAYQRTYVLYDFKSTVNIEYIIHYLYNYLDDRIQENLNGGAVPYIKLDCLTDMKIEYPDLDTQKSIASILSAYDQLLDITAGGIQSKESNLINQKKAIMDMVFREVEVI